MTACWKRLLLWMASIYAVINIVDFSAPEFDPLRTQWNTSLQHVISHKYYGDYVQPLQDKVHPIVDGFTQDYISPSLSKVNNAALGGYQVYVSKYINKLQSLFSNSALHDFFIQHQSKIDKASEKFAYFKGQSTKYTANGLIQAQKVIIHGYDKGYFYLLVVKAKAGDFVEDFAPKAKDFYELKIVPTAKTTYAEALKYSHKGYEAAKKCSGIAFGKVESLYYQYAHNFLEEKLYVHIRKYYDLYAKKYVDSISLNVSKYYNLFRLNQALDFSKEYFASSYDQLLKHLKEKEAEFKGENDTTGDPTNIGSTEGASATYETPIVQPTETEVDPTPAASEDEYESEPEAAEPDAAKPVDNDDDSIPEETEASQDAEADTVVKDIETQDSNTEIELSLAEEIHSWTDFIDETVTNIFNNFDKSIIDQESEALANFKPGLTKLLQNMSNTANLDYAEVNKAIYNINSSTVLLENGEEAEVDRNGRLIDHKITREEFRELLVVKNDALKEKADQINDKLKKFVSEMEDAIDEERKLIVDIYEEFAEVAIEEFSKKMMYSTYSSSFNRLQSKLKNQDDLESAENFKDWRDYVKVKKDLIAKREDLINRKSELKEVNNMLKEVHNTLKTLRHESGTYYAVLRAKANLAFQEREAKEQAEAQRAEDDDYTITSTMLRIQTLDADGNIHTNKIEIELPEEEKISDDESDVEDYIPEETAASESTESVEEPTTVPEADEEIPNAAEEAEPEPSPEAEQLEDVTEVAEVEEEVPEPTPEPTPAGHLDDENKIIEGSSSTAFAHDPKKKTVTM